MLSNKINIGRSDFSFSSLKGFLSKTVLLYLEKDWSACLSPPTAVLTNLILYQHYLFVASNHCGLFPEGLNQI